MKALNVDVKIKWKCEECGKEQTTTKKLFELHYCSFERIIIDTHAECSGCQNFQEVNLGEYFKG